MSGELVLGPGSVTDWLVSLGLWGFLFPLVQMNLKGGSHF